MEQDLRRLIHIRAYPKKFHGLLVQKAIIKPLA